MSAKPVTIGDFTVSQENPPFIIAEIGNNHDADKQQALDMIAAAAEAGADAVKFQTYRAEALVAEHHELYDFFRKFALPLDWHLELKQAAEKQNIMFLSSPFDLESLRFLVELGVPALKIASSDANNKPLLTAAGSSGLPVLLSTGMSSLAEIGNAVETLHMAGGSDVVVMQCESRYPAPVETANISLVCEYQRLFQTQVGFSDHSLSIHLPVATTALCARVIEKHFTLSRELEGPDHAVALEPEEFKAMATGCRETVRALGDRQKRITPEIAEVRKASIRGLYASRCITAGERIGTDDIIALRPAAYFSIEHFETLIGARATRSIEKGSAFAAEDVER